MHLKNSVSIVSAAASGLGIATAAMLVGAGIFATPMLLGIPAEMQHAIGVSVPFPPRLGKSEEYARLVRAIIENPMLNGETIRLDGALRMAPK